MTRIIMRDGLSVDTPEEVTEVASSICKTNAANTNLIKVFQINELPVYINTNNIQAFFEIPKETKNDINNPSDTVDD